MKAKVRGIGLTVLMLFIVASVLVAPTACNTNSGGGGSSNTERPVDVIFLQRLGYPERDALVQELVKESGANVNLELINVPIEQFDNKVKTMCQAQEELDLIEGTVLPMEWILNGYLEQTDAFCDNWDGFDTITPSLVTLTKAYDGHVYGVLMGLYQKILFYRIDWLEEAGYSAPPKTWVELIEMSKNIQDPTKNRYGYSFRGGNGSAQYINNLGYGSVPADLLDPGMIQITKDDKHILDNPGFVKGVELYKQLYHEISPPDSITWGYPEMVEAFYSGVTCFLIQDTEVIATCSEYMEDGTWETAPLPYSENGNAYYVSGDSAAMNMTSHSKVKDAAFEVIKAICGPEGNIKYCKEASTFPIHTTASEDPFFGTGRYKAYADSANDPHQIAYLPFLLLQTIEEINDASVKDAEYPEPGFTQSMILGEITVEEFVSTKRYIQSWFDSAEWITERHK
ncbi:MAG: sugar ABC transporter substrate-binding protein [Oscillospiraceae bacterium]|nr:sugar ABC transporter substrate-binding protein [Oscillospiraceae bacterium]